MQKTILMIVAVALGQSVLAADVVIADSFVKAHLVKLLKKPTGKFAPPPKFTKVELASVTRLDLRDTKVADAGLKEVAKLQKLERLGLDNTQITDAGLKEVAKLQKLEELNLNNTQITAAGVAELQKALPKCDISK